MLWLKSMKKLSINLAQRMVSCWEISMQTVPTSLRDATTRCYWQQTLGSPGSSTPALTLPLGTVTAHTTGVCVGGEGREGGRELCICVALAENKVKSFISPSSCLPPPGHLQDCVRKGGRGVVRELPFPPLSPSPPPSPLSHFLSFVVYPYNIS